ncbi:cytochrome P450 [Mycena metata]|uniref:Cytochrome P450 n=1 Tax=Mycena metata TaxID=1033252 RepID=A0AAD7NTK9_9AGAR|nr:cytochrome P450 [Mycena metata]
MLSNTTTLLLLSFSHIVKLELGKLPGLRSIFSPASLFGTLIPTYFWNPGLSWQWQWRNQAAIYTISLDVARQFLFLKGQFDWRIDSDHANGAEWSRHRRILSLAFTPETFGGLNALVWEETTTLYHQMLQAEGWTRESDIMISAIDRITTKFALILIARCGFGQPISWDTPPQISGMPLGEALVIVSGMYRLPIKRLHDIEMAYTSLAAFMKENSDPQRKDVFRLMIRASEGEGKLHMTDDELAGNTFLMLFAGHETTAKTLDAVIGFLAWYEDVQEEVYQEIKKVMSEEGKLTCGELIKVQSCFLEVARLFQTTETVVLKTDEEDGHGGQVILEPGTRVAVDVVGLHYNPKYFPNPEEFRPSRWCGMSESGMTMFSVGPRSCIGRRFALTEGVAFLSNLLRDWKLHIRARVMRGVTAMTLGVGEVPVRLTRR